MPLVRSCRTVSDLVLGISIIFLPQGAQGASEGIKNNMTWRRGSRKTSRLRNLTGARLAVTLLRPRTGGAGGRGSLLNEIKLIRAVPFWMKFSLGVWKYLIRIIPVCQGDRLRTCIV